VAATAEMTPAMTSATRGSCDAPSSTVVCAKSRRMSFKYLDFVASVEERSRSHYSTPRALNRTAERAQSVPAV
jgi:hypothetical protein